MKKVVLIISLFGFMMISGLVFAEQSIIKGPLPEKFPSADKCSACHNIPIFYNELSQSAHKDLQCYDCHLPGGVQKGKYKSEDCNFYRLGYHDENGKWMETSSNQVCLRCHMDKAIMNSNAECWSCHMPKGDIDNLVIVKDKKFPPIGDNIKKIKKLIHRSHSFKIHVKKK
jgi:hypothetical protein